MASFLKGIDITLHSKSSEEIDPFGMPILIDKEIIVSNVLIGEPTQDDIVYATNMYGKKASYRLGIPKGDTNKWEGSEVTFFGRKFKVIGIPIEGIEAMIPLDWNKKVLVEVIE